MKDKFEKVLDFDQPEFMVGLMKALLQIISYFAVIFFVSQASGQEPNIELRYPYGTDSNRQESVPQGSITHFVWKNSKVFPGTIRHYSVYVPAQYSKTSPAAIMVFQDGHTYLRENGDFRTPIVLDNLIHQGAMPVTIGIFIDPGFIADDLPPERGWRPRPENRSFEYDTLSPDYATFLIEEILPEVGENYNITGDPNGRAICGISSGGICAWTVAWERPDQFRKVLSHVGSFTNIRGGHNYPAIIRKHKDVKPIKIFMQAGSNDLDNQHGNWPLGNKQMYAALRFRDYDVKLVYGEGGHDGNHGGSLLPESFKWLWEDYSLKP